MLIINYIYLVFLHISIMFMRVELLYLIYIYGIKKNYKLNQIEELQGPLLNIKFVERKVLHAIIVNKISD